MPRIKRLEGIKALNCGSYGGRLRFSRSTRFLLEVDDVFLQVVFLFFHDEHDVMLSLI